MEKEKLQPVRDISPTALQEYLERYREEAMSFGASDAKIIPTQELAFDRRVSLKCYVPLCMEYGACLYCPPHAPDPTKIQESLKEYAYGILVRIDIEPDQVAGSDLLEDLRDKITEENSSLGEVAKKYEKLFEIISRLESLAFHEGHYLAAGFGAGSCHAALCRFQPCQALLPGKACRFPFKARPSMEACGMDVFKIAARAGWDIYPIGAATEATSIPKGAAIGLALID